jgi:hypothetical protein
VFDVPEDVVTVTPFDVPAHWPRLGALDFGWDHPTAAVGLATVSLHEAIELGEVVSPVLSVALQTVPLLAVALIAIGLGVVVWAWMDDHARGIR